MLRPILVALFVVQGGVNTSSSVQHQQHAPAKSDSTQRDQRGTDQLPIAVKLLNTGKSAEEAAQESQRISDSKKSDARNFNLTLVVAGASALQAIGLIVTIFVMVRTARRQLRAYVGVIFKGYTPATKDDPLSFHIRIKNYGQTPALNLIVVSMNRSILEFPLTAVRKLIDAPDPDPHPSQSVTVHPQAKEDSTSSRLLPALDASLVAAVSQPRRPSPEPHPPMLYCFGTVRYHDIFGQQHWAHFCSMFGGDLTKAPTETQKAEVCHFYNDSSDNRTRLTENSLSWRTRKRVARWIDPNSTH